ncbi:hypothetical protein ACWCW7_24495 [Nocardia tengchongensis]
MNELIRPEAADPSSILPGQAPALPVGAQPPLKPIAIPSPYYDGIPSGGANKQAPAPDPAPTTPNQPAAPQNPQPAVPSGVPDVFRQMYVPNNADAPQPTSPTTLAELAVPGYKQPIDPSSAVNQIYQNMASPQPDPVASPTSLPELAVPGYQKPQTQTQSIDITCMGVLPATPGVPASITEQSTRFRVGLDSYGFNYSAAQLAADLALVKQGRGQPGVYGPYDITITTPYDRALRRLAAARYTPEEQTYDLLWAFYDPQDEDERTQQRMALTRLREVGISPYADPAIKTYVQDQLSKAEYASDPRYPSTRNAPPPPPRPKMTSLGEDLYGMFVEPAVVLWEATHGKGNHSGGQIAWAAAEFGLNASMLIPGVGAAANGARALRVTAAEALAGTRLASALTTAKTAMEAATIGRQFGTQQVLADVDLWAAAQRQTIPPSHIGVPIPTPKTLELGPGLTIRSPTSAYLEPVQIISPPPHTPLPPATPNVIELPVGDAAIISSPDVLRVGGAPLVIDAQLALARASSSDLRTVQAMLDAQGEDVAGLLQQYGIKGRKSGNEFNGMDDVLARLNESLSNLAVVRERGFPYLFESRAHFEETKAAILEAAGMRGIDPSDVEFVVQGSSVHKPTAGDVDIALIVDPVKFEEYGEQFLRYSQKNNVSKSLLKEIPKGKLAYNRWMPRKPGDNLGAIIHETLVGGEKIQISLMKEGGEYLVAPYLR